MICNHNIKEKAWLPRIDNNITVLHPVCSYCGSVKNISRDKGRSLGFYINVLYKIKNNLVKKGLGKLTEGQLRLISNTLEKSDGFGDVYSIRGSSQRNVFIKAVKRYTDLPVTYIESFI